MPQGATLQVHGYQQFMRELALADRAQQRAWRNELRKAGDHVRLEGASLFAPTDARSAAGYRVVVRQRGVAVEQKLRRTTGQHPEFGGLQMREALVPALERNEAATERAIEQAMENICDRFNGSI